MAEDNVTGAPEVASPDNSNKRKLEELEPTELLSGNVAAGEPTVGHDTKAENGNSDGTDDASEAKRARLEEGDHAAGNGFEEDKVGHSTGDGVEKSKEVPVSGSDEPTTQQANMPQEAANHSVGDGLKESKEAPDSESVELAADGQQPPIGIVNAPQEDSHSAVDGLDESKEAADSGSGKLAADEQQPPIGIEEPADEAALEPSKEDNNDTVVGVSQMRAEDQAEADMDTVCQKIEVPNNRVGVLIGKAGETIRYLQYNSGAKIQITRDAEADQHSTSRSVELIGTLESIKKAEKLIKDVIAEADAGGSPSLVARGFSTVQAVTGEQVEIQVPNDKVGLIIGKGGETIKNLQTTSGARIQLIPQHPPEGDQSQERTVRITGDRKQIEVAREMIKEAMNQQIVRPSPLSGGRSQPAMQPRGPVAPQWGRQGAHPSHFTGYEHQQRGAYSQNQQYPPPAYGNYPQSAPRGGYGPSWEQRPHVQGPPPQGNYYGQSQGSEYGQRAPYPRGYGHGYNEGYGAPQEHPYGAHGAQHTSYPTTGQYPGYGPGEQYGKPSSYGVPPQAQAYGQPRPGEAPYQGSVPPAQPYGSSVPPQQSYPYASNVPVQQPYPAYNAVPAADGYSQPQPATASGPTYTQQPVPPVTGYTQPGGQQPTAYAQGGAVSGYSSYPSQQGYAEQPAAAANAGYGYQAQGDATYAASNPGPAAYAAQPAVQAAYAPAAGTVQGYDQSGAVSGGYGAPAPAPAAYGQMYAAPR